MKPKTLNFVQACLISCFAGSLCLAENVTVQTFLDLAHREEKVAKQAIDTLNSEWNPSHLPLIIDVLRFVGGESQTQTAFSSSGDAMTSNGAGGPSSLPAVIPSGAADRIKRYLKKKTGADPGPTVHDWYRWLWDQPRHPSSLHLELRRALWGRIDKNFEIFFAEDRPSKIPLEEILWGGTKVDGIPPLDYPKTIKGEDAEWLKDSHEVFGVVHNGVARAYPKRIVAWHELVRDKLGGTEITLVYCTLCDSAIPWKSEVAGKTLVFGTSGLLYQSNKLMYDAQTGTLWSAIKGRPLMGPLVDFPVKLEALPITVTTWGAWRQRHPKSEVISLETGYDRDYREGVAYRDYFRSKRTWYPVAVEDSRLKPKSRVHVMELSGTESSTPIAIDLDAFPKSGVLNFEAAGSGWVALIDNGGGVRVYAEPPVGLTGSVSPGVWITAEGQQWVAGPDALTGAVGDNELSLPRVLSHDAYWFGWVAQHPDTKLISTK